MPCCPPPTLRPPPHKATPRDMTLKCQPRGCGAGSCTQEPRFRSEIATSVPYFLWKQCLPQPPAPAVLTGPGPPVADTRHPGRFCSRCCCSERHFPFASNLDFPMAAVYQPADDFFFNVIQQSDNYDRLTLEEVSFLLPIFLDEDVFINLSKWSASRIGIAQLNPMLCVLKKLPS